MRGSDIVKGLYDDSEEIQAFRNHRLQSTAELRAKLGRVSAGAYASLRSAQHSLDLIHRETGNALAKEESARIEPTLRAFLASMQGRGGECGYDRAGCEGNWPIPSRLQIGRAPV